MTLVPGLKQGLGTQLRDWRGVSSRFKQLRALGRLDEAEPEIIAVLELDSNLLLREQALVHARHIEAPSDGLLKALLDVVCNRRLFVDERTLAAQALGSLALRFSVGTAAEPRHSEMIRRLNETLDVPEAQVFRQAVTRVLERLRTGARECSSP